VVNNVIMTSDERDPSWWDGVKAQGWFAIDHNNTVERFGPWSAPPFIFLSLNLIYSTIGILSLLTL
jgi:hypothetical protein